MTGSAQVSVGASAPALLASAGTAGYPSQAGSVLILPDATTDVYLGGPGVSSATGFKLAHATSPLTVPLFPGDALYAVTSSSTATIGVLQT
jgi:hypothetical protein